MPDARRRAPLILGSVTALAMVAAILAFVLAGGSPSTASPTYTAEEQTAVAAAQTEVANLSSFRRAQFDADFQRALNGTTGQLLTDVKAKRALTLKAITDGKFDLSAKITNSALIGPVEKANVKGYVVLVSFNGYRSTQLNLPTQQNLSVTVINTGGKWLLSEVNSIRVSG